MNFSTSVSGVLNEFGRREVKYEVAHRDVSFLMVVAVVDISSRSSWSVTFRLAIPEMGIAPVCVCPPDKEGE